MNVACLTLLSVCLSVCKLLMIRLLHSSPDIHLLFCSRNQCLVTNLTLSIAMSVAATKLSFCTFFWFSSTWWYSSSTGSKDGLIKCRLWIQYRTIQFSFFKWSMTKKVLFTIFGLYSMLPRLFIVFLSVKIHKITCLSSCIIEKESNNVPVNVQVFLYGVEILSGRWKWMEVENLSAGFLYIRSFGMLCTDHFAAWKDCFGQVHQGETGTIDYWTNTSLLMKVVTAHKSKTHAITQQKLKVGRSNWFPKADKWEKKICVRFLFLADRHETYVVLCCSSSFIPRFNMFSILRCFSAHHGCIKVIWVRVNLAIFIWPL